MIWILFASGHLLSRPNMTEEYASMLADVFKDLKTIIFIASEEEMDGVKADSSSA